MATLNSTVLARNTDIVVKPVPTHKPNVYVAAVVRPEDNSGPTAAVITIWCSWNTTEPFSKAICAST